MLTHVVLKVWECHPALGLIKVINIITHLM